MVGVLAVVKNKMNNTAEGLVTAENRKEVKQFILNGSPRVLAALGSFLVLVLACVDDQGQDSTEKLLPSKPSCTHETQRFGHFTKAASSITEVINAMQDEAQASRTVAPRSGTGR